MSTLQQPPRSSSTSLGWTRRNAKDKQLIKRPAVIGESRGLSWGPLDPVVGARNHPSVVRKYRIHDELVESPPALGRFARGAREAPVDRRGLRGLLEPGELCQAGADHRRVGGVSPQRLPGGAAQHRDSWTRPFSALRCGPMAGSPSGPLQVAGVHVPRQSMPA